MSSAQRDFGVLSDEQVQSFQTRFRLSVHNRKPEPLTAALGHVDLQLVADPLTRSVLCTWWRQVAIEQHVSTGRSVQLVTQLQLPNCSDRNQSSRHANAPILTRLSITCVVISVSPSGVMP